MPPEGSAADNALFSSPGDVHQNTREDGFFGLNECKAYKGYDYYQLANEPVRIGAWTHTELSWTFKRRDRKWHAYLEDGADFPGMPEWRLLGKPLPLDYPRPKSVWDYHDNVCTAVYGDPTDETGPRIEVEK